MTELLLEAHDLVAGYLPGIDILNGCNLEVAEGEIVGVIGPNGAGKSTLVKAMFGLVGVRSGHVILRGEDITGLPAHDLVRKGVGYVPQVRNVFATLTVAENLEMDLHLEPRLWNERFELVTQLIPRQRQRRNQRT